MLCTTLLFGMIEALLYLFNTFLLDLGRQPATAAAHLPNQTLTTCDHFLANRAAPIYLVLSRVPNGITGGCMLTFTSVFTYAMKETPADQRTVRLNVLELAIILPSPLSFMGSSYICETAPWLVPGQMLNYVAIFSVSFGAYALGLLWVLVVLRRVEPVVELPVASRSKRLSVCSE